MRIAFWIAALGLLVPGMAWGQGKVMGKTQFFNVTDLADTDSFSGWQAMPIGVKALWCEFDLTALSGGGSIQLEVLGCTPKNVVAGTCVDATDGQALWKGTSLSAPAADYLYWHADYAISMSGEGADAMVAGAMPPTWAIRANETATTTATYTVDCVWW